MPIEQSREPKQFADFELAGWDSNIAGYDAAFGALARQTVEAMLDAAPNCAQFPPIIFKSSGRYDLNNFTWRIARVPERMPLAARFEHPRTCLGCNDSVTKQCTEGAS